jgi:hypothetical protein
MPYNRDVNRATYPAEHKVKESADTKYNANGSKRNSAGRNLGGRQYREWKKENPDEFNGWTQSCDCDTDDTQPGIALDPFAGAGTTCMVAKDLGRRFIGIELNPEYVALAQKRLGLTVDNPEYIRDSDATGLDEFGSESESEVKL